MAIAFFGHRGGDGFFWVNGLIWLLFLVIVAVGVVFVVRALSHRPAGPHHWVGPWNGPPTPQNSAALTELDLRYARGEIERSDYLQRRADLLGQPGPAPGTSPPPASGSTPSGKA
jgi:putative membrane protein